MLFLNRQNLSLIADSETLLKIYVMYIISQNKLHTEMGFFENCIAVLAAYGSQCQCSGSIFR